MEPLDQRQADEVHLHRGPDQPQPGKAPQHGGQGDGTQQDMAREQHGRKGEQEAEADLSGSSGNQSAISCCEVRCVLLRCPALSPHCDHKGCRQSQPARSTCNLQYHIHNSAALENGKRGKP